MPTLGLVLVFLEWLPAGFKAYLDAFSAATDDGVCGNLVLLEPVPVFISSSCWGCHLLFFAAPVDCIAE